MSWSELWHVSWEYRLASTILTRAILLSWSDQCHRWSWRVRRVIVRKNALLCHCSAPFSTEGRAERLVEFAEK